MKNNTKIFIVLGLSILALIPMIIIGCKDNEEEHNANKNKSMLANIGIPNDGFMFVNLHQNSSDYTVTTGTALTDFMLEREVVNEHIVSRSNILYEFEDLGVVRTSASSDGSKIRVTAFGDDFTLFDIAGEDGTVIYKITHDDGDTVCGRVYYAGLTPDIFVRQLLSQNEFENPFMPSMKKSLTLGTAIALAGVIISATSVVITLVQDHCKNLREIDEYNCRQQNLCIAYQSRCHYRCVSCPPKKN